MKIAAHSFLRRKHTFYSELFHIYFPTGFLRLR